MQSITPFLWFNDKAEEAVTLYASIFQNAKTGTITRYDSESAKVSGQKEGSVMTIGFELCGQTFAAINGGPVFTFTPAISLFVSCETEEEIDALWKKLFEGGGKPLMELGTYPWSEKYGWLNDRFGVSWQLMLNKKTQTIAPALLFVGEKYGKAEEAINFYTSLFPNSTINIISRNGPDNPTEKEGTIQYASFTLNGQEFNAMEGSHGHEFTFTPAMSFVIHCETQEEIDKYWNKLSAVKEAEQCGWLQDKYGISWQVIPTLLPTYLADKNPAKAKRVMKAMLQMKKIDIAKVQNAFDQA